MDGNKKTEKIVDITKLNDLADKLQSKLICLEIALKVCTNTNSPEVIIQATDEFHKYLFND